MTTLPRPLVVEQTLATGQRRRFRWEPRDDGTWARYEDEFDGGQWRPVGREVVDDVDIERGEGVRLA
jgi:hypothetical protein